LDRRRLAFTALFAGLLFGLLPLSMVLDKWFGFDWLYVPVFPIFLAGLVVLWPYRLLFLVLVVVLSATGILYRYGDIAVGILLFLAPYAAACIALGYRIAERLSPLEWVEPSYPEEPEASEEYTPVEPSRLRWNPYAGNEPVPLQRGGPRPSKPGIEEDPCGGDELIDLLLERGADDPEAERLLHEYMECRAKLLLERLDEPEKSAGVRVKGR